MQTIISTTVLAALLALASCQQHYNDQHQQPYKPPPAILNHKQALAQDGSFQYSFAADNGLQQGETISPDGSRKGAYSYVDPNGKTITVTYTADKNGFHVQGDHLPKPVLPIHPQAAPQPQYQPQQSQYRPQQQYQAAPQTNNYQQEEYDQGFNYEPQNYGGGFGPATFPPAPPRQPQSSFSRPQYVPQAPRPQSSHHTSTYTQEQQNIDDNTDYNAQAGITSASAQQSQISNGPHNFGTGYSFQFGG